MTNGYQSLMVRKPTVMYVQSSIRLDSHSMSVKTKCGMIVWRRSVSTRGLNASLPRRVHPEPIELVFYE